MNYGNGIPRDLFSVQTGFDLFCRRLRINALFDYKGGYSTQDGANNFQCNSPPLSCRERRIHTRRSRTRPRDRQDVRHAPTRMATLTRRGAGYFMNGQFWKWRELSAVANLPDRLTHLIACAERLEPRVRRAQPPPLDVVHGHRSGSERRPQRQRDAIRIPDRRRADVLHASAQSQVLNPRGRLHDENSKSRPMGRLLGLLETERNRQTTRAQAAWRFMMHSEITGKNESKRARITYRIIRVCAWAWAATMYKIA